MQVIERLGKLWLSEVDLGDFRVRAVLVPGEERVVVWDTLSHPDDMRVFLPLIRDLELAIVYSHADWDHIWGTAGLPHDRANIIGQVECLSRFSTEAPATLAEKAAEDPRRWQAVKLIPPATTFVRAHELGLGTTSLLLRHLPGHTPDSIVGILPDEGVLLAGDSVEAPFPLVPAGCDLGRWIDELCRLQADSRVKTVIPSHGPVGGPELLGQNIGYLRQLLAGREIEVPETLDEFYRETHLANLRAWCGGAKGTRVSK